MSKPNADSVCGHAAFVVPRDVGVTLDIQRDWDRLQRYLQYCVLPLSHAGDHDYEAPNDRSGGAS